MKISMALEKIDEHQLFVPMFQREYVWNRDDAKLLIDSLIKEYPIGTMLTWNTNQPPEIKGNFKYDEKQGSVLILLDGQQRLTTLYMLIRGKIPPYYTEQEISNDIRGLYVNVETLELEYYSARIKMENDPRWQSITKILTKHIRTRNIVRELQEKGEEVSQDLENKLDDHMRAIDSIRDRDFLEQSVPPKASVRKAIDIFYKVNAGGVTLTDAELALAQIVGYWPEARDAFKQKLAELKDKGFDFKLDFIVYVLLGCLYHLGSELKKLHAEDNSDRVRSAWQQLDGQILDYVVKIMRDHAYVDHTDEINSIYALIPIIVFCYDKQGGHLSDIEIRKIVKWFYYSQIRSRYVSQMSQKLDQDLRTIHESSNPFDELLDVIQEGRSLEITPRDFVGRRISNPLFGLMRWYFKSRKASCLTTGGELRRVGVMGQKFRNDRIFLFSKLKPLGYNRENRIKYSLAQEFTNRTILLASAAKRSTGSADAKYYLANVAKEFPGALSLQCIPEDRELWKIENFENFLKARREMLAKGLNSFLEGITSTQPQKVPVLLAELIEEGESVDLEFKSSLRWDFREGDVNKNLEEAVIKTVASFLNTNGGILLIGVDDDGAILGLDNDYRVLGADKDKFERHLRGILSNNLGKGSVATNIKMLFPKVGEYEICQLKVQESRTPVVISLKDKQGESQEKFYIRNGNLSEELSKSEMSSYIHDKFQK